MKYIDFLNYIMSGITYLTLTGLTDVIYTQYTLEDLIELDPESYPGSTQLGKSIWLTPIPMTFNTNDVVTYGVRVYVAQQIKDDYTDRFSAISSCIELCNMIIEYVEDDDTSIIQYPVNIVPVLLFDATIEGLYFDLNVNYYLTECYF